MKIPLQTSVHTRVSTVRVGRSGDVRGLCRAYKMQCRAVADGALRPYILSPESIQPITGLDARKSARGRSFRGACSV